jgi:hypothetical protein
VKIFFTPPVISIDRGRPGCICTPWLPPRRLRPQQAGQHCRPPSWAIHATARRWAAHAADADVSASLIDMDPRSVGHRRLLENLRRPMRPECA